MTMARCPTLVFAFAVLLSGCRLFNAGESEVKDFTVAGDTAGTLMATVGKGNVVTFTFVDAASQSSVVTIIGQEAGPSEAVTGSQQDSGFNLLWKGINVGTIDASGHVVLCSGPTEAVCDAQVQPKGSIDPVTNRKSTDSIMRIGLSTAALKQLSAGSTQLADSAVLDISQFAMPQIDQRYSGTCLYNATTAILEWYRNRALGVHERLSAPDVLARLDDAAGFSTGERYALENTSKLVGVLPDEYLPTQGLYSAYGEDESTAFATISNYARAQAPGLAGDRVPVPGPLHGKVLYLSAEPARGIPGSQGATLEQMQMVRDWIAKYQTPVQFFAYYGNIWHSVVALGYRDDGWLLIHDSLGQKAESATWVSLVAYQQATYGAIGTWSDDQTIADPTAITPAATPTPTPSPTPASGGSGPTPPAADNGLHAVALTVDRGGPLQLYAYVSILADKVEMLNPGDGQYYELTTPSAAQPGYPTIRSIMADPNWANVATVQVRVTVGSTSQVVSANISH